MLWVSIWSGAGFSTKPVTSPSACVRHEPVGGRVLDRRQRERRLRAALLVQRELGGDVEVGEHVAVEHQEPLVEQRLGELQRAAGAERLRLLDIAQADPVRAPVAEHVAHARREEPARHHDVVDAVAAQPVEHERDERAVDERDDRLRHGGGQRAQPRPLPAGEDQRLHQPAPFREGRPIASYEQAGGGAPRRGRGSCARRSAASRASSRRPRRGRARGTPATR